MKHAIELLLSMSFFVCLASLFVTTTSTEWQQELIELGKRSRRRSIALHRNCTRNEGVISARCRREGSQMDNICTLTENGCEMTTNCTRSGRRWQAIDACSAICWSRLRPFIRHFYGNLHNTVHTVDMDVDVIVYGNNGNELKRQEYPNIKPANYLNETGEYLNALRLRRFKTFIIRSYVPNCQNL